MVRMEVARMFGVLPILLKQLPLSEFRLMCRYYRLVREQTENPPEPTDGVIVE